MEVQQRDPRASTGVIETSPVGVVRLAGGGALRKQQPTALGGRPSVRGMTAGPVAKIERDSAGQERMIT